jgi:preprotein translocase subunit SecD
MNRYPLWKYAILLVVLLISAIYALPNLFGESPAVQVSAARSTVRIDSATVSRVEQALAAQGVQATLIQQDANSVKARFANTDDQLKARDALEKAFNPDPADPGHVVALNLADLAGRLAHVPRPGSARGCALHAAGRHARGAAAPRRCSGCRPAQRPA